MSNLTLTAVDSDALVLGGPAAEGGDVRIYRDGSNNLALFFDADAASNAKALDIYGGVVFQNYLTVGQATLNTSYAFAVYGNAYVHGSILVGSTIVAKSNNQSVLPLNIGVVSGTSDHSIILQIDENDIIAATATGNGAGGVVGKRSIQYGGQCHAKTDAGAADYNPSTMTSDYIITVDTTAAARAVTISTEDRDSGTPANPRIFIIKDIAGNAGANNITISLETAGNIDGAGTAVINANYGSVTLMIDGTNGFII